MEELNLDFKLDCTLNDVKKLLYKENPNAILYKIVGGLIYYSAHVCTRTESNQIIDITITFAVPFTDIGDATFFSGMHAKYLIRWIETFRNNFE